MTGFVTAGSGSEGVLNASAHSTLSHSGVAGVPAAEAFTSAAHDSVNHKGAPFSLLDASAHASIDHAAIIGAGIPVKQQIIQPKGWPHGYWWPRRTGPPWVVGDDYMSPTPGGSLPSLSTVADAYGQATRMVNSGGGNEELEVEAAQVLTSAVAQPRCVFKLGIDFTVGSAVLYAGFAISATTAGITGSTNAVWVQVNTAGTPGITSIERRVGGISKSSTPTGILNTTVAARYYSFDFQGTTALTVTIYDAAFASLFTTTFVGAGEVPQTGFKPVFNFDSASGGAAIVHFYGAGLSHGG